MKDTVSSRSNLVKNLSSKDMVVIWGGTRDIGNNESTQALKEIKTFVQAHSKINVIVISAPHRYDLSQTSCVNQEVKVFNWKLCKYLKVYNNTLIVEVDSNRDYYTRHGLHLNYYTRHGLHLNYYTRHGLHLNYYTRHGLHLNRKGKELTAKKIALVIQNKLNTQNCDPIIMRHNLCTNAISLPDQANTTTTNHEGKFHKYISSAPIQHASPMARVSLRHKKPPRSLTDDFLW